MNVSKNVLVFSLLFFLGQQNAAAEFKGDLAAAAARGDEAEVVRLLKSGEVDDVGEDGETALFTVTVSGSAESFSKGVNLLIKHGANVNFKYRNNRPLLASAMIASEFPAGILPFLENGADPNATDKNGETPIVMAAKRDLRYVILPLLAFGADPAIRPLAGDLSGKLAIEVTTDKDIKSMLENFALSAQEEKRLLTLAGSLKKGSPFPPDIRRLLIRKDFTTFVDEKFASFTQSIPESLKHQLGWYDEARLRRAFVDSIVRMLKRSKTLHQ
jgi:ankyrin repeat protein